MPKYLYVAVEQNIFELPIAVADSPKELSEMLGVPTRAIAEKMSRARKDGIWCEYVRIPCEGEYRLPQRELIKKKRDDKRRQKILMVGETSYKIFGSVGEAAQSMGVNVSTINRWVRAGEGMNRKWRRL